MVRVGKFKANILPKALEKLGLDPEAPDPVYA
jgi:hypothetical protein